MDRIAKDLFDSAYINRKVDDDTFHEAVKEARYYYKEKINRQEDNLLVYMRTTKQLRAYLNTADKGKRHWIQQALDHSLRMTLSVTQEIIESQDRYVELETYIRLSDEPQDIECPVEMGDEE